MSSPNNTDKSGFTVEIFKLADRLKKKLGGRHKNQAAPGYLDPEAINEAGNLILETCADAPESIGQNLETLSDLWNEMRDMAQSPERTELANRIFYYAHEIKDIGALCGYEVAAHFAESLRDFVAKTDLTVDAQRIIIQAHVDALTVVHKQGMRYQDNPKAEDLKNMVDIAIRKYS